MKDPSYNVHHFKKEDVLGLDKILETLPKRKNCILVFDDVSYLFEKIGNEKMAEILHSLTIVREKLDPEFKQTRVIVFLLFHYSFALVKGLRTTNFRVICSVSDEEFENYRKVLGYHNGKHIFEFTKKYLSMMRYEKFKITSNTSEPFVYYTDKPFRIALVSNLGELHYTLYHKSGCGLCTPQKSKQSISKPNVGFWDEILRKYGYNHVFSALTKYAFVTTRKPTVDKNFRSIWHYIEAEHRLQMIDLLYLVTVFKQAKKIRDGPIQVVAAKRQEFILSKLKEMEAKAANDSQQVVSDSLSNVDPAILQQGDENSINIDYQDAFEDDEEDDEDDDALEKDLDADRDSFNGGLN